MNCVTIDGRRFKTFRLVEHFVLEVQVRKQNLSCLPYPIPLVRLHPSELKSSSSVSESYFKHIVLLAKSCLDPILKNSAEQSTGKWALHKMVEILSIQSYLLRNPFANGFLRR
uniref:Uncharacterized protein n=1 Tax=Cryptomonas curvata TaxID=233186 RepID=A0A7S0QS76_9CRYP